MRYTVVVPQPVGEGRLKTSIYLSDELAEQVRAHCISISQVAQAALRQAVQAAAVRDEVITDIEALVAARQWAVRGRRSRAEAS
jgi:post-segregation antitoxin (ccd killing protein)